MRVTNFALKQFTFFGVFFFLFCSLLNLFYGHFNFFFFKFCFQCSSCHSFNTSCRWCKLEFQDHAESLPWQKFLVPFSFIFMLQVSKQHSIFSYCRLLSHNNRSNLDWKYRNGRKKGFKKVAEKIFYLL